MLNERIGNPGCKICQNTHKNGTLPVTDTSVIAVPIVVLVRSGLTIFVLVTLTNSYVLSRAGHGMRICSVMVVTRGVSLLSFNIYDPCLI